MTIHDTSADILKSLKMQIGLVHKKMENLEQMEKALQNTTQILEETNQIDWTGILNLIHLTDMETVSYTHLISYNKAKFKISKGDKLWLS